MSRCDSAREQRKSGVPRGIGGAETSEPSAMQVFADPQSKRQRQQLLNRLIGAPNFGNSTARIKRPKTRKAEVRHAQAKKSHSLPSNPVEVLEADQGAERGE